MFGLSTPIKFLLKRREAKKQIEELDKAIVQAEQNYSQPFITTLSGVERFESAVVLIDSTLLKRISSSSDQNGKEQLVQVYLNRLNEEYQMAKEDLQRASASRAEVVALGLAVKEIALSLDREIAVFREQSGEAIRRCEEVASKHQKEMQRQAAELTQQITHIREENKRHREGLTEHFERLSGELRQEIKRLDETIARMRLLTVAGFVLLSLAFLVMILKSA